MGGMTQTVTDSISATRVGRPIRIPALSDNYVWLLPYAEGLAAAVVLCLDERHVKLVGRVRQLLSAGHTGRAGAHDQDSLLLRRLLGCRHGGLEGYECSVVCWA